MATGSDGDATDQARMAPFFRFLRHHASSPPFAIRRPGSPAPVMGYFLKAKTQTVQIQIQNIGTALELYYMENGAYPSANVGLKALVEAPAEAPALEWPEYQESAVSLPSREWRVRGV
jgi:hypothetical protein